MRYFFKKLAINLLAVGAFALLFSASHSAYSVNLVTEVDRSVIGVDETFQLMVRLNEQVSFSGPDFDPLEQNFEVLNQMRTNQFRNINGRSESWTEWVFTLAPKFDGQLLLPSLKYKDAFSEAISITVNPVSQTTDGTAPDVFIETKVDKDTSFVQEQILLSYSIHIAQSAGNLRDVEFEPLELPNVSMEVVADNTLRRTLQGRSYFVREFIFALYPQQSLELEIPSLLFALTLSRGSRGWNDPYRLTRGEIRRLRSEKLAVNVQPKPADYSADYWVPATKVTLEDNWGDSPSSFKVGEPITRTITMSADGLTAAQLPPFPSQENPSFKVYTESPQLLDGKSDLGITGRRIENLAIVPTEAGMLTLPEIEIGWWDTQTQQQKVATLPAQRINVAPAAINTINLAPPTLQPQGSNLVDITESQSSAASTIAWPWVFATILFASLSVAFLAAWLKARTVTPLTADPERQQQIQSVKEAANVVRKFCSENDPVKARAALIQWAQCYWQDSRITQLQAIIDHAQHTGLSREIENLDKYLYSSAKNQDSTTKAWQGNDLWKALYSLRRRHRDTKNNSDLAPLYPAW